MLTPNPSPSRGYFETQQFEADSADRAAFVQQLYGNGIQVSELGRPPYTPPGYVYSPPVNVPFVKSDVSEKGSEVDPMSSTALAVYQRVNDPVQAVESFGRAIAAGSGLTVDQGKLFALECLATGEAPFFKLQQYHVIEGRLSMRADAMLAEFNKAGGKHRIISRTPDLAAIELTYEGSVAQFSFSWGDALGEPMVYKGKEQENVDKIIAGATAQLKLKPKYATPRARMQMLWARVVSDAIRAVMPSVNYGRYTPEEVDDFEDRPTSTVFVESNGNGNGHAKAAPASSEVVDAEFKIADGQPATTVVDIPCAESRPAPPTPEFCTELQAKTLRELRAELEIGNADWLNALNRRNAGRIEELTYEAASELCNSMQMAAANRRKATAEVEQAASEPSRLPANKTTAYNSSPATQPQIDKIRGLLKAAPSAAIGEQLAQQIMQHLHANGCVDANGQPKLNRLTITDADLLAKALGESNIALFIDSTLRPAELSEAESKN